MKVPLSWIKDYVDIDIPVEELAEKLTRAGLPVEGINYISPQVSGLYAGRITRIWRHPNADKLFLTLVDVGDKTLQVATAASNVKEGDVIPLAVHGAKLADGLKIKKSKIRGEESNGMMCSANELGIEIKDLPIEQREGILLLPSDTPLGADITELFCMSDPILEFETFANRPDQLSVLGIARETAAILNKEMKMPSLEFPAEEKTSAEEKIKIIIEDKDLCSIYTARIIENIQVKKSPLWIQGRLQAAGIRSINNIVDITNYVMLETGQPMHAFDLDKIQGDTIYIRPAKEGEIIKTIDGEIRELNSQVLVIADKNNPIAIAGVMGGLDSEVNYGTVRILLESAVFNPASVRRTSIKLKLPSESSKRFEKGIDYHQADYASRRACSFFALQGAKILSGFASDGIEPPVSQEILLRPARVNEILGTNIDPKEMEKLLVSLDFEARPSGENYLIKAPSVRRDINYEIDLIEEIARLWGYNNIPETMPLSISQGGQEEAALFDEEVRDILTRCQMWEIMTPGLYGEDTLTAYRVNEDQLMRVLNPVTEDQKIMRADALPHMIETLKRNLSNKVFNFKLFELTKIYKDQGKEEPKEFRSLSMLMSAPLKSVDVKGYDFFALKGVIEFLAGVLGIEIDFKEDGLPSLHPGKSAVVTSGEAVLGHMGQLHPEIALEQGIEQDVFLAVLSLDLLRSLRNIKQYKDLPRFPSMERDLAVVVDEEIKAGQVEKIILESGSPLVNKGECFDVYKGQQVPEGKKSLAFSLAFSSPDRTLTDAEVQEKINIIISELEQKLGASLRS